MSFRIFYVEDEGNLAMIVKETLILKGYIVQLETDGQHAMRNIADFKPDICVLDVMLPTVDGFSLGKYIRNKYPQIPIIFLTAKSQPKDVLEGFSSGGTDYLKKPFSIEELIARINSQLLLVHQGGNNINLSIQKQEAIPLGVFLYYPHRLSLVGAETIQLSNREAEVLNVLCQQINTAIDRKTLMQEVWGDDSYFISRNLDVYIRKLRSYFSKGKGVAIITLKGKGYLFSVE